MDFINIMEVDREEDNNDDDDDDNGTEECGSLIRRKKRCTDVHKLIEENDVAGKNSLMSFIFLCIYSLNKIIQDFSYYTKPCLLFFHREPLNILK